ncbi:MAG: transglycosylase domain-containing protein, partial [Streptosporangiaceae bacterium]
GRAGYDHAGFDRTGYDRAGFDRTGYDSDGYDRAGYDRAGRATAGAGARRGGGGRGDGFGRGDGYDGASGAGYDLREDDDWDEDDLPGAGGRHSAGGRGKARAGGLLSGGLLFWRSARDESGAGGGGKGGGKGGKRPKQKGDWWRHWTWKKVVAVMLASGGAVVVAVAAWIGVSYASTPIPTDVSAMAVQQASTVYFSDGKTVVGTFGTVDRQVLTYNQIPAQLRNAVLAAEDRSFYSEGGISPSGIIRAAYEDVTGSGDALQGGSTITEQFVKNYYANVGSDQTISNKIKEIFIAVKLAREKSKAWILTQYLNTIYFGDGAYGVEAAAETYFGKPVGKLDVAQDAMIAAMLNAPGQFDPTPGTTGYSSLVGRWNYVVQGMVTMHNLSAQTAKAQKFPSVVSVHQQT